MNKKQNALNSTDSSLSAPAKLRRQLLLTGSTLAWGVAVASLPGCGGGDGDTDSGGGGGTTPAPTTTPGPGTTAPPGAVCAGGTKNYTSNTAFTVPSGCGKLDILCYGGGGGGGAQNAVNSKRGRYERVILNNAKAGDTYRIRVGSGGGAGKLPTSGATGGNSGGGGSGHNTGKSGTPGKTGLFHGGGGGGGGGGSSAVTLNGKVVASAAGGEGGHGGAKNAFGASGGAGGKGGAGSTGRSNRSSVGQAGKDGGQDQNGAPGGRGLVVIIWS
ncbi:MAG: hypothetical protein V3V09_04040 [Arenicellales bacterium]